MPAAVRLLAPEEAADETLVGDLARLVNDAYAVGEAGLWREGRTRTTPAEMADAIRGGWQLAATLDGRLVGCATVRPLGEGIADLGLISTATGHWGGGIGRQLVRSAEELMRSRGVTTMQLEVLVPKEWSHPAKEHLRRWYTRLGYRMTRSAPIAASLAQGLATPCEFLVFRKPLA